MMNFRWIGEVEQRLVQSEFGWEAVWVSSLLGYLI
jgi:hypothetical protein